MKLKPRNRLAKAVRDPSGPYRPSVVPNKKAFSKSERNIWRKNLKGYTQGYDRPRTPIGVWLGRLVKLKASPWASAAS